ncbi:hypothetical protein BHM03_00008651 [Ensete ventricosum]|nr:hypothetical protein BHM03_00008651 [Ensete ventricosum]
MEAFGASCRLPRAGTVAVRSPLERAHRQFSAPVTVAVARSESGGGGNRLFVFGTGFVGRYVSDRFISQGWYRYRYANGPLSGGTIEIGVFPRGNKATPRLPTQERGDASTPGAGMRRRLVFEWGDEAYPPDPKTESAKSRLAAEKGWLDLGHELGVAVNMFRLGGIYGPGRRFFHDIMTNHDYSSALDTIIKGQSLSEAQKKRESRLFTARVHVADIYQAIKASMEILSSGLSNSNINVCFRRIYNVVDDDPAPRQQVFAFAQSLLEERWAGTVCKLDNNDMNHAGCEKRVSNARLKKELGVRLMFPTYRLGLRNILESWNSVPKEP